MKKRRKRKNPRSPLTNFKSSVSIRVRRNDPVHLISDHRHYLSSYNLQ